MKKKLTLKQRLFCRYYLETIGNGTEAVIKAGYKVKHKNNQPDRILAKSIASENLTKPDISAYINLQLKQTGFNDTSVLLHHLSLINQNTNLHAKNKAIDMYYKVKGKYSPKQVGVEHGINERLKKFLDRQAKRLP